ncbi:hypothetical protein [Streptomyces sp. NPDC047315]|uniref:hypothetical protein n=1 Tax=Streptomyces sp. NPDC047315 TaxID=3155142 RepID=UPI0033C19282
MPPTRRRPRCRCRLAPELVQDGDPETRQALAANPSLGAHGVALLAKDPHDDIRSAVALRHDLTEEQRATVRHDFDPTSMSMSMSHTLPWVEDLHGDADAMRRLAASSHPLVRRSVACARHLPPDVVARLARDPEAEVRRRAAEDPRLSPADAVRLLDDPKAHVRSAAVRNTRLPAHILAGLLHDRETARAAVTDPAIPVPVLHRILTAAAAATR